MLIVPVTLLAEPVRNTMNYDSISNEYPVPTYSAAALRGMGDRRYQEDTYLISSRPDDRLLLAMIADGMGGMQDGRLASRTAVGVVEHAFRRFDAQGDIAAQLLEALTRANDDLYNRLHGDGGSTGVACVFCDYGMYYAGVGDSFLLLRRGQTLYRLNRRQNVYYALCTQQIRRGVMNRAYAERHPERNALTGWLGMKDFRDVDRFLYPLPLFSGDTVLLCSDGIGDVLSDEELLACMSEHTADGICRRIDQIILDSGRHNQDNYSAVAVRCE